MNLPPELQRLVVEYSTEHHIKRDLDIEVISNYVIEVLDAICPGYSLYAFIIYTLKLDPRKVITSPRLIDQIESLYQHQPLVCKFFPHLFTSNASDVSTEISKAF